MPDRQPRRRRLVLFAAASTLLFLVLLHGTAEFLGHRMLLPISVEDAAVFVVEPLLETTGGSLRTTPYAEVNSAHGEVGADKGGAWRLVALGGSFMFGDPYGEPGEPAAPGGIPFWIGERLGGERPVEVLNLAGLGDTSIRVREKARLLADVDADVLLVATGNNEFPLEPSPRRAALRRYALVRLVSALREPPPAEGDEELAELHRQAPPRPVLRSQYRANLEAIADAAVGTPLLLATLPNNLLHGLVTEDGGWDQAVAPCMRTVAAELAGGTSRTGRWVDAVGAVATGRAGGRAELEILAEPCLSDALEAWRDGRPDEALAQAEACPAVEGLPYAGVALAEAGRLQEAVPPLELWAEIRPFGIRPSFNREVRAVARREGVHLVDLQAAALARGLPGPGLFVDSCHLHWSGYAGLAEEVIQVLVAQGLAPGQVGPPPSPRELMGRHRLPPLPEPIAPLDPADAQWTCPGGVPVPGRSEEAPQ